MRLMYPLLFLAALVTPLTGCTHSETYYPRSVELSFYMAVPDYFDADQVSIRLEDEPKKARLFHPDGSNFKLFLTAEEQANLFALFSDEKLADIYALDSSRNRSTLQGPDCTNQDPDIQTICQALIIAQDSVFGNVNYHYPQRPVHFSFRGPGNLYIETAHMLVTLDNLRLRIREQGLSIE